MRKFITIFIGLFLLSLATDIQAKRIPSRGDLTTLGLSNTSDSTCEAPTDLTQTSTSTNSIGLSWIYSTNNSSIIFNIKVYTSEIALDSINSTTKTPIVTLKNTTNSVIIRGLTPASTYYFYVQAQYDTTHQSTWIGPLVAITDCNLKNLPYTYDFNNNIDGTMPPCWIGTPKSPYIANNPEEYFNITGTPVLKFNRGPLAYAVLPEFSTTIAHCALEFDYVNYNTYGCGDIIVGYITNACDSSTFVHVHTFPTSASKVHVLTSFETVNDSITGRIVIGKAAGLNTSIHMGCVIDNVKVFERPACWAISEITQVTNTTETGFTVHWKAHVLSTSHNFRVEYGPTGFVPGTNAGTIINVTDTFCTITGLQANSFYDVYVASDCGTINGTSSSKMSTYKTLPTPADGTNYSCNFEDTTENIQWTIKSTPNKNSWEIGTQDKYEGRKGLYVIKDNGVIGYQHLASNCWAYRDLHCPRGLYTVTLQYKSEGEANQDYMNYAIIPGGYTPRADNNEDFTVNSIPTGWITDDPLQKCGKSSWVTSTFQFSILDSTDITLAFQWYDNSDMNASSPNYSACIDNISISRETCCPPFDVELDQVSSKSAHFTWNSYNYDHFEVIVDSEHHNPGRLDVLTSAAYINRNVGNQALTITGLEANQTYYAYILNHCSDTTQATWTEAYPFTTTCTTVSLPYIENFDTNAEHRFPPCWTFFSGATGYTSQSMAFSNNQSLHLKSTNDQPIKIALPMVNMPLGIEHYQLVFEAYNLDDITDEICLYSSENILDTTPNKIPTKPIPIDAPSKQWKKFIVPFKHPKDSRGQAITMGNEQIIFITIPSSAELYLDDITLEEIPTCSQPYNFTIQAVTANKVYCHWDGFARDYEIQCLSADSTHTIIHQVQGDSAIISGLNSNTDYSIQVRALCSSSETSAWSQAIPLKTKTSSATTPYFCGFEPSETESTLWTLYNDTTNQWIISSGAPLTNNCSMYISNNHLNANYSASPTQYSYAVRTIHFEKGTYDLSFSWKCQGEEQQDYVMVGLMPDFFTPQGGSYDFNGTRLTYDMATPKNSEVWGPFNGQSTVQSAVQTFSIRNSCDKKLIFAWKNNRQLGSNLGAVIDDITITKQLCTKPLYIYTEELTETATKLSWLSTALRTHVTIQSETLDTIVDTTVSDPFLVVHGLTASTAYTCQMYNICSTTENSAVSDLFSFTTPCETYPLPFDSKFEENYYKYRQNPPNCWTIVNGLANLEGNTESDSFNDEWCNWNLVLPMFKSIHESIRVRDAKDWCITPLIAMDEDVRLSFYVALTDHDNWHAPENKAGVDDKFAVLISRDYGNSWQTLSTWEYASEPGHKYYDIPNTYKQEAINIPCDTDHTPIKLAFYAESTKWNSDNDIHLTCIHVNCALSDTVTILDTIDKGEEYPFGKELLTEAGDYFITYISAGGCDSTVQLSLSVNDLDTVEISDQFCEGMSGYYQYGFSIDDPEEKDYSMTKTSSVTGYNSTTILHLSMINTVYGSTAQTICDHESYNFGGKEYYAAGTYKHTFASTETGCDSIVTLTLTVNPTYTVDVSDTITTKELPYTNLTLVVPVGTEVGKYDYTIESATEAGCDSTINLTLTITTGDGLTNVNVGTLNVYPNVVKGGDNVTITTDFSERERQEMSIRLYDATGKLIATYQPQSTSTMSYTMPSVSGMYYLRLETKSGKTFSGKLIIL